MVTFARLIVPAVPHQAPATDSGHDVPKVGTLTNCFTFKYDEEAGEYLSEPVPGILANCSPERGNVVVLGAGSLISFVHLDRHTPPTLKKSADMPGRGGLFSAGVRTVKWSKGVHHFLTQDQFAGTHVLLQIHTGHEQFASLKRCSENDHRVSPLHGDPQLIGKGACKSRAGQIVSRVYLCDLKEGDAVEVFLATGERRAIGFEGGKLWNEVVSTNTRNPAPTSDVSRASTNDLSRDLELAWKQACNGVEFKNRDGGRHHLISLALESVDDDLWQAIYSFLLKRAEEDASDVSEGLLRRICEKCPIAEVRYWASEVIERKRTVNALMKTSFMAPTAKEDDSSHNSPESNKRRLERERKRADRSARNRQQTLEIRNRPRPGEDGSNHARKRSGKGK